MVVIVISSSGRACVGRWRGRRDAVTCWIDICLVSSTSSTKGPRLSQLSPHRSFQSHRVASSPQRSTGEMSWMSTDMSSTANTDKDGNSSEMSYTSSLQYLNSQLVAHGFAHSPGISLDGLSTANTEGVVKVLLSLLNQRVVRVSFVPPFFGARVDSWPGWQLSGRAEGYGED